MKLKHYKIILQSISFIFIMFNMQAFSQEAKLPCFKEDGGIGLKGLDKFDCSLIKSVVNDPKIKSPYENKVLNKLADEVTVKATQRLEEMSLLDQYFSQNNKDLTMNSSDVATQCRLDKISSPKCGKATNPESYKKKLDLLISHFPMSAGDNKNSSLFEKMKNKFSEMRGAQVNNNQCPLSGKSGAFYISSQLTEGDASVFIESLKKSRTVEVDKYYSTYPQLKMLKNAAKNGKSGEKLFAEFETSLKGFDESKGESAKKFINSFLFTEKNQQELAKSLASQCTGISENIKDFLCEDLEDLGVPQTFAKTFFVDNEKETDIEISKGFSCDLKKYSDNQTEQDEKKLTASNSIYSWDQKFKDDTRPAGDDLLGKRNVKAFCEVYQCSSEISKALPSCLKGGPVSSADILDKYCKDANGSSCKKDYLNWISYLASLEKDKKEIYEPNRSLANNNSDDSTTKPKSYSSFYQNLLGVEGTLLAEGKKITPIAIEEKKAEFAEKKIDPTVQTASLSQSREIARAGEQREDSLFGKEDKNDYAPAAVPPREDPFRRTFNTQQFAKSSNDTSASPKTKKSNFVDNDSQRMDEMKKMRSDLADAMNKIKGSDEEKLAAIADNNAMAVVAKNSKKDTTANLNSGEKDRLNSYRDSLSNWESRLRNWEGQLSDRDVRANSGNGSSASNDVRPTSTSVNDQGSSNAGANALKLTKATSAGAAGGKVDGVNDKATGTEKGDLEAGIVNSEKLATLQKDSLKKLGIVPSDSFIIKVRYQDKIYAIPVKTFTHDGKSMFVPLLSDKNRELSKIVYDSPLFKDYRDYQIERQYKLEKK